MAQHPKIKIKRAASDPHIKRMMAAMREKEWSDPDTHGALVMRWRTGRGNVTRVWWDHSGPDGGRPAEVEAIAGRVAEAIESYNIPPEFDLEDDDAADTD